MDYSGALRGPHRGIAPVKFTRHFDPGFAVALGLCASVVCADPPANLLTNPGFEEADPIFVEFPLGWAEMPALGPRWREIGDDPFNPPLIRSGRRSIDLPTLPGQRFAGWTTNTFGDQGQLFDPPYEYGAGPLVVRGYYAIPANDPLLNVLAGLKLEFRRTPPNFSIYLAFEDLSITGHTDGQWRRFEFMVSQADFDYYHQLWGGPWPPFPTSVSVLPLRFLPEPFDPSTEQSGTIYWDDLEVVQLPPCPADLTTTSDPNSAGYGLPDGQIDAQDFFYYLDLLTSGDSQADLTGSSDPNAPDYGDPDGTIDAADLFYYLDQFVAGCLP